MTLLLSFLEHSTGRRRRLRAKFLPRSKLEGGQAAPQPRGKPWPAPRAAGPEAGATPQQQPAGGAVGGGAAAGGGPFAAPEAQRLPFLGLADALPAGAPAALRPVAPPERQHVLGRKAPVRGSFAGQLLSEPLLQSLLGRLGPDVRAPSLVDEAGA